MNQYSIANTTREERERIVEESLGNMYSGCDGCAAGIAEMYQPYIDGVMEISECTRAFNARYVKDMDMEDRGPSCGL